MNVGPIGETAGIRRISSRRRRTVFQKDHARLLLLEQIHAQRGFLRIWRCMPPRSGGIHATDFPVSLVHTFQRSDVLVQTVYEHHVIKGGTIVQPLQIAAGNQPFIFQSNGEDTVEAALHSPQTGQCPVPAITFGNQCIARQVQRNGLVTLHSERIRHTTVSVTHEITHQRSLPVHILIILQHHPLHRVPLHVLNISQTVANHIPLEGTHRILIRIGVFQRISVIKQIFGKRHIVRRQQLLFSGDFHYGHNGVGRYRHLCNRR